MGARPLSLAAALLGAAACAHGPATEPKPANTAAAQPAAKHCPVETAKPGGHEAHASADCPEPEAHPGSSPQAKANPLGHGPHGAHDQGAHGHGHGHNPHPADHTCPTADHRFDDPAKWAKVFDDPARDAWQKPKVVVQALALAPGDKVADIGTGTGYFVPHLASAVPKGHVFAIDVEPKLLKHVKKRATAAKLSNVSTVLADKNDPKLPRGVNVVLLVDTYHHIGKRMDYFRGVQTKLAPKGRVVIVDFRMGKLPVGPPDSHKLPSKTVQQEMTTAGYALCSDRDILPHQYVLVFARPGQCP